MLVKLVIAFVLPTVVLFSVFAVYAYRVARNDLEAELGARLSAVASSMATQVRGNYLVHLEEGDEDDRGYLNVMRRLRALKKATGAARIYVFDAKYVSRADTEPENEIGSTNYEARLARLELTRVFSKGEPVASVAFRGEDGRWYQSGFAAVRRSENEPEIVLALGIDAPAAYFTRLAELRSRLLLFGALLAFVVLAISVITAALITRPVRKLVAAAERIGRGELDDPVERASRDEIGFLAETMDEMRGELGERDRRMQLMLAGIAHEVRNPLGGIELFAGILRDEIDEGDERRQHVARIEKELVYLKAVVNDFLEYARRPAPELGRVELTVLVEDVIELVSAEAAAAEVTLDRDLEAVVARADPGQLRRAVLNLTRNAIQAAARGDDGDDRFVRIELRDQDGPALEVHNGGPPIPEDVRERIFEPFFTTREKGTGLGLAFTAEIVSDHGGSIEVSSDAHRGTCFTIRLPAAPAQG